MSNWSYSVEDFNELKLGEKREKPVIMDINYKQQISLKIVSIATAGQSNLS